MSVSQELIIEEETALEEDVGAELDYFIFLTLLGIDSEAQDFAIGTLWPHLQHFPVLAEIANYFIGRNDLDRLKRLLDHVEKADIKFDDPEECLFLTHMRLIEVDQDAVGQGWHQTATNLTEKFDSWTSETSLLNLEVAMTVATRNRDFSPWDFVICVTEFCSRLLDRQMFEHAARMFCIVCSAVVEDSAQRYKTYLQKVFKQLSASIQQALDQSQQSQDSEEAENLLVYTTLTNISFLTILRGATRAAMHDRPDHPHEDLKAETEQLLRETQERLPKLFEDLPNSSPRGRHFLFLRDLEQQLEEMSFLANAPEEDVTPKLVYNMPSNFFTLSLVSRGIPSSEIRITKATRNNQTDFNILSKSVMVRHGIQYEPHVASSNIYQIIGRAEFICRLPDEEHGRRPRIGQWLITPDALPDGAQALLSASWMRSASTARSGESSRSDESMGTLNLQAMNKAIPSTNPSRATPRYLYQRFPQ